MEFIPYLLNFFRDGDGFFTIHKYEYDFRIEEEIEDFSPEFIDIQLEGLIERFVLVISCIVCDAVGWEVMLI